MYKYDKTLGLVTVASPLNQNLSLLDADEYLNAELLAVVHDGYVNVIPVLDFTRRSKYVPLSHQKGHRGKGLIKTAKWLRVNGETIFVISSTAGIQIYDAEVTDIKCYHSCREAGDDTSYAIGACVLKGTHLCVGTNFGTVWVFTFDERNYGINLVDRFCAHNESIALLEGFDDCLVTSSGKEMYFWKMKSKEFKITRKIDVKGLISKPTSLKIINYLIFIGYESGEICIFDLLDKNFLIRTVAHKLEITCIDFSILKYLILTASSDCYVKLWSYDQNAVEASCIFSLFNDDGPLCAAAFLNSNCLEFCTVTCDDLKVKTYVKIETVEPLNVYSI